MTENNTPADWISQKETSPNQPIKNKNLFENPSELFDSLKSNDDIKAPFFVDEITNFQKQNPQGYQILASLHDFILQHKLDAKDTLALTLLIEKTIHWKGEDMSQKLLSTLAEKKPALLFKLIDWFHDDVNNNKIAYDKSLDTQNKHSQEQLKDKNISQSAERTQEKTETNQEKISQIAKALKSQISEQAPEFKEQITTHQEQIQNEYGLNTDQAYLLAVAQLYDDNPDFQAKVKLDESTLWVLNSVQTSFGKLSVNNAVNSNNVKAEISEFASSKENSFDATLKEKIDSKPLSHSQLLKLVENQPYHLTTILEKYTDKDKIAPAYKEYLANPNDEKHKTHLASFQSLDKVLSKRFQDSTANTFAQEYKNSAISAYTGQIMQFLHTSVGMQNISNTHMDIKPDGEVSMTLNYHDTPTQLRIDAQGNIYMTSYSTKQWQNPDELHKTSNTYEKKETKINHSFHFTGIKELLNPDKIDTATFLNSTDPKLDIKNIVNKEIDWKVGQNTTMSNKSMMQGETKFMFENNDRVYSMLKLIRPDTKSDKFLDGEVVLGQDSKEWKLLAMMDKSLNSNPNASYKLNNILDNEKFQSFFKNFDKKEVNTYEAMEALKFFDQWKLNIDRMQKFVDTIGKISNEDDVTTFWKNFEMENYKLWLNGSNKLTIIKVDKNAEADDWLAKSILGSNTRSPHRAKHQQR